MFRRTVRFCVIAGIALLVPDLSAGADGEFACGHGQAVIVNGTSEENLLACEGVERAANLFSACGLPPVEPVRVSVAPGMLEFCGTPAHGSYNRSSGEMRIASLEGCKTAARPGGLFGIVPASDAWRSIVAHETAHATIIELGMPTNRLVPHEFIAAIVQLAALPDDARSDFLSVRRLTLPVEEADLNAVIYGFDPLVFARKSWHFWQSRTDPCAYLRETISGEHLFGHSAFLE